jgi:hypothetical protein
LQQNGELVATHPCNQRSLDVVPFGGPLCADEFQSGGNGDQEFVAGKMAQAVIDRFEVIQVEKEK